MTLGNTAPRSAQEHWAARLRQVAYEFRVVVAQGNPESLRHRPGPSEWSANEVIGHMIDKLSLWTRRLGVMQEQDNPALEPFDPDATVREQGYQEADTGVLLSKLEAVSNDLAKLVEGLPRAALDRTGVHARYGQLTVRRAVESALESVPVHLSQARAAMDQHRGGSPALPVAASDAPN
jgi:hypothetical protein